MCRVNNTDVNKFITDSLQKGYTIEKIRESLVSAGWDISYINKVLDNQTGFNELVAPSPGANTSEEYKHFSCPLYSIGYLIGLISFFISFFAMYYLFATATSFYFPDRRDPSRLSPRPSFITIDYLDWFFYVITFTFAAVVVATPIYVIVLFFTRKYESVYPLIRRSYSRKFHIFAILIVTFISTVGSAIGFVFNLLSENLSTGRFLNFFVLFTVSIIPFIYYLLQTKDDNKVKN